MSNNLSFPFLLKQFFRNGLINKISDRLFLKTSIVSTLNELSLELSSVAYNRIRFSQRVLCQSYAWTVLCHQGHIQLFVTPWTIACQAPLSMGFPGVDCHGLLQGILLTQGLNLCLVHCWILYC